MTKICTSRRVSLLHTPRTSDRAYVRFLTESAILSRCILHHNVIWSEFLSQDMMRYRRPPQVWVREWNLWALRDYLCQLSFSAFRFSSCEVDETFRHHLVNLRGHVRQNLEREGYVHLASFAKQHRHEQVLKSCHERISTH